MKSSEFERKAQFSATAQVMGYINIAGGMNPVCVDASVQAGNSNLPINTKFTQHPLNNYLKVTTANLSQAIETLPKPKRA